MSTSRKDKFIFEAFEEVGVNVLKDDDDFLEPDLDDLSEMEAIKKVAKERKIPKSDVYREYHGGDSK